MRKISVSLPNSIFLFVWGFGVLVYWELLLFGWLWFSSYVCLFFCSANITISQTGREIQKTSLLYPGLGFAFLLRLSVVLLVLLVLIMGFCRLINIHGMYSDKSKPKENTYFQRVRISFVTAEVVVKGSLKDSGQYTPLLISQKNPIMF